MIKNLIVTSVTRLLTCAVFVFLWVSPASLVASQTAAAEKVDIVIPTLDSEINTVELRGQVVYLDFWASWCVPCRKSFPWMNAMHEKYKDQGLTIIAINVDKDSAAAAEFLNDLPAQFLIGYDPKAELAELFELPAMPSAFIVSKEGELIDAHYGFKTSHADEYEASIVEALGQ